MRKVLGVLLLVLGVPILVAGAYAAFLIGPDDTATTGPHRLTSTGPAIVTTPQVLAYVGPTLHLTVTSANDKPVFLGIGPQIDVRSYLGASTHREITDLVLPWKVTSAEVGTDTTALAPPADQPWWIVRASGAHSATLTWPLPNGRYQIVGLNADGSAGVDVDVVMGLEVDGAFYGALAVTLLGLLLLLLGLLLLLWKRLQARRAAGRPVETTPELPAVRRDAVGPGVYTPSAIGSGFERVPIEPVVIEPAPIEPAPIEPAPIEPAPIEPARIEPVQGEPFATEPVSDLAAPRESSPDAAMSAAPAVIESVVDPATDPPADPAADHTEDASGPVAGAQPAWPFTDGEPTPAEQADPTEDSTR